MRKGMHHGRNLLLSALTALVLVAGIAAESRAQTPPAPDRDAIETIVRDYLLKNPEIIEEAIGLLRTKRQTEMLARVQAAIRENDEALRAHPMSPVSGNAHGDVTLVEFFDYQCGYCKRALGTMEALLDTDADVRVVWKEFPILGPVSSIAARAAMAADRQDRYLPFHLALMRAPELTEEKVFEIAGETGLDIERLRRDMEDPTIDAYLEETRALARELGIEGTPPGRSVAIDLHEYQQRLARSEVDQDEIGQIAARVDGQPDGLRQSVTLRERLWAIEEAFNLGQEGPP